MKRVLVVAMGTLVLASLPATSYAQSDTDTQMFTVLVEPVVSIVSDNGPLAAITHDTADANQVFPAQPWTAFTNNAAGADVTLETITAFENTVGATTYERDARLDLAINAGLTDPVWSLGTTNDQTSYGTGDRDAAVTATSTGPGTAGFELTVTFIDNDYSLLPTGTYALNVVGTITAK